MIKNHFTVFKLIVIGVLFTILFALTRTCKAYNEKKDQIELLETISGKLDKTWKDKDKATHTVTPILETKNTSDFIKIKTQDEQIKALQQEVAKYKKQLGKKGSITVVQGTNKIDTVYLVLKNDLTHWRDSIKNKYIDWKYSVDLDKDNLATIKFSLLTTEDLVIVNKVQSNGWFKKDTFVTEVVNKNPYSQKVDVSTYRVNTPVPVKHWGIGPSIVYGIGNDFEPQWIVGVGLQYNFIRL